MGNASLFTSCTSRSHDFLPGQASLSRWCDIVQCVGSIIALALATNPIGPAVCSVSVPSLLSHLRPTRLAQQCAVCRCHDCYRIFGRADLPGGLFFAISRSK